MAQCICTTQHTVHICLLTHQLMQPHGVQLPQAHASLTAGESVKNPRALLRYALPIQSNEVRQIQVGHLQAAMK